MKRVLLTLPLLMLLQTPAIAGPSGFKSVMKWFKNWKLALERSAVESRYRRTVRGTAVAAVRGNPQELLKQPYWKGTWSAKKKAERMKEREELAGAVELLIQGDTQKAMEKLEAFAKAHPKSTFLEDVRAAQAKAVELKALDKPKAKEAPAGSEKKSEN